MLILDTSGVRNSLVVRTVPDVTVLSTLSDINDTQHHSCAKYRMLTDVRGRDNLQSNRTLLIPHPNPSPKGMELNVRREYGSGAWSGAEVSLCPVF